MALTIQDDMIEASSCLERNDRLEFFAALVEYSETGKEPKKTDAWYPLFVMAKYRIEKSQKMHELSRKGNEARWNKTPDNFGSIPTGYADGICRKEKTGDAYGTCLREMPTGRSEEEEEEEEVRKEKEIKEKEKTKSSKFAKPSLEDVRAYITKKGYNVSPEKFWNFYESKGWLVGKTPMKSWHSAVAGWNAREKEEVQNAEPNPFLALQSVAVVA